MSKFINVKINLNKIVKVDADSTKEAISMVENELPDLELTNEWLNSREVTIKENNVIQRTAEQIAELYSKNPKDFTEKELDKFLSLLFDGDEKNYIYEEVIDILKNKYKFDLNKNKNINI